MKKIGIIILASLMSLQAFAQNDAISRFFNKYVNDPRFTVVSVSPKMFQMLSKVDWNDVSPDVKSTVENLTSLRILTTDSTPVYFYHEAMEKINTKEYEELMTVRDGDDNVRFLVKEDGNTIHELLMIVGSKDDFTLMSFVGNIDLDKISKLAKDMNIQGMDQLQNLKKKHS